LDHPEFKRWRDAASDAHRAASVQRTAAMHNWACFLAEQAAQLAVKGLLHGIGSGAWGHDLVALGEKLRQALGTDPPETVAAALRRLSRHYIPPRYPDAHPGDSPPLAHYGASDADEAIRDTDLVIAYVDQVWERLLAEEANEEDGR
jgi:HEPN domain-containing protein